MSAETVAEGESQPKKSVKKEKESKNKFTLFESFRVSLENEPIKFLSFSQRKFMGFRFKYKFDRKRVLMASDKTFCIVGYDTDDQYEELIKTGVSDKETIKYSGFLEDERP